MFREMRRHKQQLSREECENILINEGRGILNLQGDDGYPYPVPINYYYEDGKLYFHCASEGHKIDAINRDSKASFCVMDKGEPDEEGYFCYVNSVVAFGRIRILEDRNEVIDKVRKLAIKYYPDAASAEAEVEKDGHRVTCLALEIEHMSGKHVHEK